MINRLRPFPLLTGLLFGLGLFPLIGHTWPLIAFPLTRPVPALIAALAMALLIAVLRSAISGFVARLANREIRGVQDQIVWAWLPLALPALNLILPGIDPARGWALILGGILLAAAFTARAAAHLSALPVPKWVIPALAAALAGIVFWRTMAAHVGQIDTFEFQVKAHFFGVSHPPGYPLYMILNHLAGWLLPFGSFAWRVNLTAVIPALLTVGGAAWLARKSGLADGLSALLAALALAFSLVFWQASTAAEVYTLHALLLILALAALLDLITGQRDARPVYLLAAALGLGSAHHLMIVFIIPAAALAMIAARPRLTLKQWFIAFLIGAAAAALRLTIPLRWPALTGETMTLQGFIDFTTGAQFAGAVQWNLVTDPARWAIIGRILLAQFGPVGAVLAGLGLIVTVIRRPLWGLVTAMIALPHVVYALAYTIPDIEVFLIPVFLIMVLWMAAGVAFLIDGLKIFIGRSNSTWKWVSRHILLTAFALLPLSLLVINWTAADRSASDGGEAWGRRVIAAVGENAVILADSQKIAPLEYLHEVEGLGPEMDMVVRGDEPGYRESLNAALNEDRPVYLARPLPGLEGEFYLRSAGDVVEVSREPLTALPPDFTSIEAIFGGEVGLVGMQLPPETRREGEPIRLTLAWTRLSDEIGRYEIRLRLRDTASEETVWEQGAFAAGGMYPTNAWKPGEIVLDYHEVSLDYGLSFGRPYMLEVGVFPPYAPEGLTSPNGSAWLTLETVEVLPAVNPPQPAARLNVEVEPGLLLLGYDAPETFYNGVEAAIALHWLALSAGDFAPTVEVSSASEPSAVALGHLERGEHRITRLLVTPAAGDDAAPEFSLSTVGQIVATFPVQMAPPALANFAGIFTLESASLNAETVRPGAVVGIDAVWTARIRPDENYTVFVQAIGPDERLWGQVDTYPLQGTLLTSAWTPGETIQDRYNLQIRYEAPLGTYRIILGFYLLRTGERLDMLDEAGTPIADFYTVGTLNVQ